MKINKGKLVLYAAAVVVGAGIAIQDHSIDHTKGFCPISYLPFIGDNHQGRAMAADMREKGYNPVEYATYSDTTSFEDRAYSDLVGVFYDYQSTGAEPFTNLLNNYAQRIVLERPLKGKSK